MTQLPSRLSVVTLGARDLPRLRKFYEGLGWSPLAGSGGGRSGYFADPEDKRWEIAWAPGAIFDERGAVVSFG
jgi:catechol 2,3-dioxygenase-like lactoylglutathione lyase family enzyme